ncbi:HAMP domain-containing histidine kinase [Bacillaceae bacterium SIJ1]|uniref:sensor histidine kinase n=1 Tax=Litoribacterium kuwaitense TaxID=1398745 RepID=UPI0013EC568A|nr:HAMP domain-containing sensor histidine kinase [Litoribacterium kuwaitense]NGP45655.1 HAMP domain-containing histidine kinase [Litoribacterium kuwaitense]
MAPLMNKISLRMRITLIVALVLLLIAAGLTTISVIAKDRHFVVPQLEVQNSQDNEELFSHIERNANNERQQEDQPRSEMIEAQPVQATIITEARRSFTVEIILAMVILTLVGIFLTYVVVGRALAPLTDLSQTTQRIDEKHLDTQIPLTQTNDEVASLTTSFNSMLSRLKASFDIQKHFATNAAHELKTPLTTMKSSMQVLQIDGDPTMQEYKENIEVMKVNVDRLIEIVNQLLMMSSPEIENKQNIQLDELIHDRIQQAEVSIKERNIRLQQNLERVEMQGNPILMTSLVDNILSNAIKYNNTNGLIAVALHTDDSEVILEMTDFGIGIPEEKSRHIFEPFYRADPSRSKEISGSGLGLSIVKTIVDHMKGRIEVESKEGEGTKIRVYLPYQT